MANTLFIILGVVALVIGIIVIVLPFLLKSSSKTVYYIIGAIFIIIGIILIIVGFVTGKKKPPTTTTTTTTTVAVPPAPKPVVTTTTVNTAPGYNPYMMPPNYPAPNTPVYALAAPQVGGPYGPNVPLLTGTVPISDSTFM